MDAIISGLLEDIKAEQQISPFLDDTPLKNYIKDGIFDIENNVGFEIDFAKDLKARTLLKTYVLYANHKRLSEFKQLYGGDYIELHRKYYTNFLLQ